MSCNAFVLLDVSAELAQSICDAVSFLSNSVSLHSKTFGVI